MSTILTVPSPSILLPFSENYAQYLYPGFSTASPLLIIPICPYSPYTGLICYTVIKAPPLFCAYLSSLLSLGFEHTNDQSGSPAN